MSFADVVIMNVVLRDLDLHFQGQIFLVLLKKIRSQRISPTDCLDSYGPAVELLLFIAEGRMRRSTSGTFAKSKHLTTSVADY